MLKNLPTDSGQLRLLEHTSRLIQGNPLGDPHVRQLPVWLPPQYNEGDSNRRFPVLFDLVGYTGSGWSHTNWRAFDESVPQQAARLIAEGKMGPVIIVFPDCFTALGGNQYINSSAIGPYADYLTQELIPFIDAEFRTLPDRAHRGCFGKSSGGYGAMVHGMKYAENWGAIACHSGDAYFDFVYRSQWPAALNELIKYRDPSPVSGQCLAHPKQENLSAGEDDGRAYEFLKHIWQKKNPNDEEVLTLMMLAMAASYDPAPSSAAGFKLPFNLETGELIVERWQRWLENDPIHMVSEHQQSLRSLKGIFMDCGWRDQYFIQYGSRILSRELDNYEVPHVYEEFDGTHSAIDHRMDVSLPFLYQALKP